MAQNSEKFGNFRTKQSTSAGKSSIILIFKQSVYAPVNFENNS